MSSKSAKTKDDKNIKQSTNKAASTDDDLQQEQKLDSAQQDQLRKLTDDLQALRDENIRLIAEMRNENQRNKEYTERQVEHANQSLLQKLVPVLDAMDAGLTHDQNPDGQLYKGLKMTHDTLLKVLSQEGIQTVDPLHEEFNPDEHEALGMTPSEEHPDQTITHVIQKGYRLHNRIIRPAKVMVATKPE